MVPAVDFSMSDLPRQAQTLSGDTDTYTLRSTIAAVPAGVDALTFTLGAGGTFAAPQDTGCTRTDDTHVRCDLPATGRSIDFKVDSTSHTTHGATITLAVPTGYDDPDTADNTGTVSGLRPGTDLHLAALQPDNASPANDDDQHQVSTTLTGVRPGLGTLTYTLTGDATFVAAKTPAGTTCTASGTTLTCAKPTDGALTFTSRPATSAPPPTHHHRHPRHTLPRARPHRQHRRHHPRPEAHLQLRDDAPQRGRARGLRRRRPLHAAQQGHRGPDRTPRPHVRRHRRSLRRGPGQQLRRDDTTHVTCTDLGNDRNVDFRVDSDTRTAHDVGIALRVPTGYDDPSTTNNGDSINVTPGTDLAMGPLTPAAPTPQTDR